MKTKPALSAPAPAILFRAVLAAAITTLFFGTTASAQTGGPSRVPRPRADLFVAPNGSDAWSGRLPAPNRAGTDGPLATLGAARDRMRTVLKTRADRAFPPTVLVRGGFYSLAAPVVFGPEDSGPSPQTPITYAAFPREKPVFSGGARIKGWMVTGRNRWEVTLPEVASGRWNFSQLYVNDERRFRPRLPKQGFYQIAGDLPATEKNAGKGYDRFRFRDGEIRADWHNRGDVEVLPFHVWTMSRFRIAAVDTAKRAVTFTGRTIGTASYAGLPQGNRYLVENVREALSEPGEWYLDRATGVLTYLARPGEDMRKTVVVAPRLDALLRFEGDAAKQQTVQNIAFSGIAFAHASWNLPPEGNSFWQAEVNIPAAVTLTGARQIAFTGCAARNTGSWAVEIGAGCRQIRLTDCEFTDLGAGGVKVGETAFRRDDDPLLTSHNTITNCLIAHGGRVHPAAIGVWLGHTPYNSVTHNDITDFYYTGISPGWSWGYGPSGAHHNTISDNHIWKIGQGVLSDMGGIYTLGVSPGTVLDHNRLHDVRSFDYGGWGIYFDEGTLGVVATNNVAYDTKSAPFHQHYGANNVVENNIFAFGTEAQLMRTRADNGATAPPEIRNAPSFTLRRNIIYWRDGPLLGSNWSGTNFVLDSNLYWNAAGRPVAFPARGADAGTSLADWQKASGQDRNSLVADPLFTAPDKGDFRLRPGSPALQLGFRPIDIKTAGRVGKAPYTRTVPRAFPPPPPPAPPQPIADDFEDADAGDRPGGRMVTLYEEADTPGATIRVTGETAQSGSHSLKFTDAPGQKARYNPHLHYRPNFTEGTLVGSFAVRIEPGAVVFHEWRDSGSPYRVGPSLRIEADGTLTAGGKTLMTLPHGRWVGFEIACALGDRATGRYDLTVRLPGRVPPSRFAGLPCGSGAAFRSVRWWGFVSDADAAATFYLDDVRLAPR
jgi:hypothetical protein